MFLVYAAPFVCWDSGASLTVIAAGAADVAGASVAAAAAVVAAATAAGVDATAASVDEEAAALLPASGGPTRAFREPPPTPPPLPPPPAEECAEAFFVGALQTDSTREVIFLLNSCGAVCGSGTSAGGGDGDCVGVGGDGWVDPDPPACWPTALTLSAAPSSAADADHRTKVAGL